MNWFRYYTNSLDHPKIQKLPVDLFRAWVNCLCMARLNNGYIFDVADAAFRLRASEEKTQQWIDDLLKRRLLDETPEGIRPHDWDEHQYPSDSSTERSRKSRQRRKQQERNVAATAKQRPRIEQNRVEQIRSSPIGEVQNPPTNQIQFKIQNKTQASELLCRFPGAEGLPGEPDDEILDRCLLLAGDSPERLSVALRAMFLAGKRPSISWAWFPKVLEQYLQPRRGIQRERRA